jgi:hypothetical protein
MQCDKCHRQFWNTEMRVHFDVERLNPKNRHLKCQADLDRFGVPTEFLQCPFCGRNLYADGRPLWRRG